MTSYVNQSEVDAALAEFDANKDSTMAKIKDEWKDDVVAMEIAKAHFISLWENLTKTPRAMDEEMKSDLDKMMISYADIKLGGGGTAEKKEEMKSAFEAYENLTKAFRDRIYDEAKIWRTTSLEKTYEAKYLVLRDRLEKEVGTTVESVERAEALDKARAEFAKLEEAYKVAEAFALSQDCKEYPCFEFRWVVDKKGKNLNSKDKLKLLKHKIKLASWTPASIKAEMDRRKAEAQAKAKAKADREAAEEAERVYLRDRPLELVKAGAPIQIWTDGACKGNPGPGAWAWIAEIYDDNRDEWIRLNYQNGYGYGTNNQMEIMAISKALEWIADREFTNDVNLYSDSMYALDAPRSITAAETGKLSVKEVKKIKNYGWLWHLRENSRDVASRCNLKMEHCYRDQGSIWKAHRLANEIFGK